MDVVADKFIAPERELYVARKNSSGKPEESINKFNRYVLVNKHENNVLVVQILLIIPFFKKPLDITPVLWYYKKEAIRFSIISNDSPGPPRSWKSLALNPLRIIVLSIIHYTCVLLYNIITLT
jgi:hypothetical protein